MGANQRSGTRLKLTLSDSSVRLSGITHFTLDASDRCCSRKTHHMEDANPTALVLPKAAPWSLSGSKRLFDVAAAILLVTAAAPLMVILALVVKPGSQGPFWFPQNRVASKGKD